MKTYKDWICRYYSEHEDDEEDGVVIQELIRCRDCAEWKVSRGIKRNYCGKTGCIVGKDDFCSKAEPKEAHECE